ncbi:MAG: S16 family serine protease, partial [Ignisphaera sp.]
MVFSKICNIMAIALTLTVVLWLYTAFSQGYTVDESRHVTIVAVSQLPNNSYIGVAADLYVRVVCPGQGHVYVETYPLSEIDLQASTRVAAIVASAVANKSFWSCDYFASIKSDSPIIGGPSASGVTAVAFAAALLRLPLNESVVMTGMIMPDGSIGPVGGVYYKLGAAASRGAKVFLVPYGQTTDVIYTVVAQRIGPMTVYRTVTQTVDLVSYGARLGVVVKPVANVYEALHIFTNGLFSYTVGGYENKISEIYDALKPQLENMITDIKKEINRTVDESKALEPRISNYYVRQLLSSIDSNLNGYIASGKALESQGQLYSAASSYFQALIYAYWRLYLLNAFLNSSYVPSVADSLRNQIYKDIAYVVSISRKTIDLSQLSTILNTLDRLYEAYIYLNNSLSTGYVDTSTQYLALASARLYTAMFWQNLTGLNISTNVYIKPVDLDSLATVISALAQNIYSYIIAFSSSVSIPQSIFSEAQARYIIMSTVNTSIERIALGISSIGYTYLTLLSMFMENMNSSIEALNSTVEILLTKLDDIIPIDVPLLLELSSTGDIGTRIYSLARLSMLLSIYNILEIETAQQLAQPTTTATQTKGAEQSLGTCIVYSYVTIERTVTTTQTQVYTYQTPYTVTQSAIPTTSEKFNIITLAIVVLAIIAIAIALRVIKTQI